MLIFCNLVSSSWWWVGEVAHIDIGQDKCMLLKQIAPVKDSWCCVM